MNTNIARRFSTAFGLIAAGSLIAVAPSLARDDDHREHGRRFSTELSGYNEVHFNAGPPALLRGAVSTKAKGKFRAAIDDRKSIFYELEYEGLEGTVTQAHIHFGQKHTVGGIVVWLCQTAGTPAPAAVASSVPLCPQDTNGAPVRGIIEPGNVLTVTGQGIDAEEFEDSSAQSAQARRTRTYTRRCSRRARYAGRSRLNTTGTRRADGSGAALAAICW